MAAAAARDLLVLAGPFAIMGCRDGEVLALGVVP
jgi:hypothetical protein